jgi:CTP synthase (UTP-ammonia lyase)
MVTAPVLYEVPLLLEKAGVADFVVKRMKLKNFTLIVGAATLILGLFTLYRLF